MSYRSRYTRNQKRNWIVDGVILSVVSSGIIGGALAYFTEAIALGLTIGVMVFAFMLAMYFSGTP